MSYDMKGERIVLAGGSGFLGRLLSQYLSGREYEVVVLTRRVPEGESSSKQIQWDGQTHGSWADCLNGARAVINLAGRNVNCRYNDRNRREIMDSRIYPTRVLGEAIGGCANPPEVWLNSSTATIYKHSLEGPMDESGDISATPEAKDAFSVEVACEWERTFEAAQTPTTRKVALRTAMVLGTQAGTVLHVLSRLVRRGLGGQMGNGKQYVSWIHELDFCRAIEWLISRQDIRGPMNVTGPNPLPNRELMRALRKACGKSFGLPAARWMLEIGAFVMQTETELIIKSRRVVPGRLLAAGFDFCFPEMEEALNDLLPKMPA
jgi:hypothetical protein